MKRILGLLCFPLACYGQSLEFGVKGGVPVTRAFETGSEFHLAFGESATSGTRRYTVGPMLRAQIAGRFDIEFDALYKRLGFVDVTEVALATTYTRVIGNSWEFPLLGSYRFLPVAPYISAGPSFRVTTAKFLSARNTFPGGGTVLPAPSGSPILEHRSGYGVGAAGGAQVRTGRIRISLEGRYTRWAADVDEDPYLHSNHNQFEMLLGLGVAR